MQAEGLKGWQCFWLAFLGLDGPWVERVDGLPSWGLNCFAFSGVSSFGPVFMTVGYLKSLVVLFALKLAQWGTDAPTAGISDPGSPVVLEAFLVSSPSPSLPNSSLPGGTWSSPPAECCLLTSACLTSGPCDLAAVPALEEAIADHLT